MKDVRVTTKNGGVYVIRKATWLGTNLVGHTDSEPVLRVFVIDDTDELEEVTS